MEYAWNRRWIPSDVGGPDGNGHTARIRSFKALWQMRFSDEGLLLQGMEASPCMILLGEPGMGKSYAVRRESLRLKNLSRNCSVVHIVDLLGSDSAQHVRERLFFNQIYRDWRAGRHELIYFIDSVDRSGTPVDHVLAELHNELRTAELYRLRLRLVCRDYDWSMRFADGLRSLWGETSDGVTKVHVFQLAPLSEGDIRLAARCNNRDPEEFMLDLETADALALAVVPITLEMLLQTGDITSNRLELYEKGIRRLCRQAGERDVSEKRLSERVKTASRIAAVMVLGDSFRVDIEGETIGDSVVCVRDLLRESGSETEEKLVRETINTGLFEGARRRSWSHQSFAECLAAIYLSSPEITAKEIVKFTTNGNGVFATQLYEVLRWLVEMRSDVLNEIVERQPALLLTTDLSHLDDNDFRRIYKAMLSLEDPYIYSGKSWELKKFRATHPSAGPALLPYLQENEENVYRRRFVLDLLACHGYPDMEDTLVDLTHNEYEDPVLRRRAARGLLKVGSVEARLALKPYVFGRQDDPDDEIKGYALQALWPEQLTAEELFEALRPPMRENFYGSYKSFLIDESFLEKIEPNDWPAALKWVVAQPSRHEMPISLQDLPGKIMRRAWDNRHLPGMFDAFAQAAIQMTLNFNGIFGANAYDTLDLDEFEQAFVQASEARRELVLLSLPLLSAKDERVSRLTFCRPPMVVPTDLDWLLGLLDSESDESRRGQLAELVARLFRSDIEKVYYASERHPEVKERTKHYFESRLDDLDVISERKHFREMKKIDERIAQQRAEVRPHEVIATALDGLESGETWQWHNVIYGLSLHPRQDVMSWQINPDITDYPNWDSCDEHTQRRIAKAAETYLREQELEGGGDRESDWYFTSSIPRIEYSAYLAIFLMHKTDTDTHRWAIEACLRKWSKVVVWFPFVPVILNDGRTEYYQRTVHLQKELLHKLYRNAPQPLLNSLRQLLVAKDSDDLYIGQELDKIDHLWDPALETTLLDLMCEPSLSAKGQRSLLDFLLNNESVAAASYAKELISSGNTSDEQKGLLIEYCTSLMTSASKCEWPVIWRVITSSEDMGRAIIEKCAEEDGFAEKFGEHLSARELADLFLWIEERYPSSEDPQIDGVHTVSTREQVGRWRNGIITQMRAKNSTDAHSGIIRILDRFPQLDWIQFVRVDLEETVKQLDWQPATPSEVLDLTVVQEKRLPTWKKKSVDFMKQHWKWLVGIAAKYLPNLF